ncbi:hypothetical protein [Rhodococcus sp. KBS0724]|uniref:hypothetical protein n=1 Tax=Rhodococcus sp. KBS0724 TaxID=1179674 RepID=UPI00163DE311|nr:hypothetical protein [Rhodococcus sp. KBS0724]
MSATFSVPGLGGITFTAEFDPDLNWLTIAGRNADDKLVSKTGISVTPDVVEDVPILPEPIIPEGGTEATAAHIESFAPPEEVSE